MVRATRNEKCGGDHALFVMGTTLKCIAGMSQSAGSKEVAFVSFELSSRQCPRAPPLRLANNAESAAFAPGHTENLRFCGLRGSPEIIKLRPRPSSYENQLFPV
jgi:hypothetical protein